MSFLNEDQMLDELRSNEWQSKEPRGKHPARFCQANEPDSHQDNHSAHEWWSPEFARTRVFGNKVERTLEVAWYWCDGRKPPRTNGEVSDVAPQPNQSTNQQGEP